MKKIEQKQLCLDFHDFFFSYIESFGCEIQSTHFALAFEVPGGWNNEKDSVTLTVMQVLYFKLRFMNYLVSCVFLFSFIKIYM